MNETNRARPGDWRQSMGRAIDLASTERFGLISLAVARIGFGAIILLDLAIHLPERQRLWGPQAWYDAEHMERDATFGLSLFALGDSAVVTDLLYAAFAVAALLFAIGWRTTWVTPSLWVLMWSFHERNPYLTNGGDNLARIILFYLIFAQLDAFLSVRPTRPGAPARSHGSMLRTVAHNAALAACMLQLCVLYMGSALFKIQGEKWQEGTAVYYITRVAEYNAWPEISGLLALSPLAITAATYLTVFAQLSFPFTLLRAWSRHLVLFVLVGMHLGIGALMGLPIFSAFMIAADMVLVTDAEWRQLARWARRRSVAGVPSGTLTMDQPIAFHPAEGASR